MVFKVSGGKVEEGVVFGNAYDKYGSKNPIVRWMMNGFDLTLENFVAKANPSTIHEVGCGEGFWVNKWNGKNLKSVGSDFSHEVIAIAKENAVTSHLSPDVFNAKSIYDLTHGIDNADLIVCCEVMEHLEDPERALKILQSIVDRYLIISVPREPVWCVLNMARGKYIRHFGNTPGHIQHWSKRQFIELVGTYFKVIEIASPFPWTMLMCEQHEK